MEGCPAIGCIILEDPLAVPCSLQASLLLGELCWVSQEAEGCTLLMTPLARVGLGVRREVCVAMGRTILENPLVSDCQPPALLRYPAYS